MPLNSRMVFRNTEKRVHAIIALRGPLGYDVTSKPTLWEYLTVSARGTIFNVIDRVFCA
jgi:hypothetical protein